MKKSILIVLALAVGLAAFIGLTVSLVSRLALFDVFFDLTSSNPLVQETNILVLGLDVGQFSRSDTIMVLHVDPEERSASLVSIPRDTIADIPGRGLDKINHAHAYGGVELSRRTVEDFLRVSIPYYVVVNLDGIAELIDDLGGITVNVPKRMYYTDYAGGLNIDLQPGVQKLSGKLAMGYLRFRHSDNDFARIGRQQQFLYSLAAQLKEREKMIRSPTFFFSLLKCVDTNLSSRQVLGLALALRSATESKRIKMTMVPGSDMMIDGIYYLRPDQDQVNKIISQYLTTKKRAFD